MRHLNHFKPFKENKKKYVIQCSLAGMAIFILLYAANIQGNDVIIASVGATAYTIFAMPHQRDSKFFTVIGAYTVAMLIGIILSYVSMFWSLQLDWAWAPTTLQIVGALAITISMFIMVIANIEHPPAAAMALGIVINEWSVKILFLCYLTVFILLIYRQFFKKNMMDL